jgi:CelD/BcsL family acetyltransferase involved in cellulose biosynthesis
MRMEAIRLGRATGDWNALGEAWRALEAEADGSFFQSWTWVGCRVAERFTNPLLLRASEAGRVVGLALFNVTGPPWARRLWLHETGSPAEDSVFIEHNGPLLARGRADLLRPLLAAALRHGRLMLSGVGEAVWLAARDLGACQMLATRKAPCVRLAGMTGEADWLAGLSHSTRYRLRRSRRSYEAQAGPHGRLEVRAAADVAEGLAFLDTLAALHQAHWVARGKPGAFAEPAFVTFHRELLARGMPRGELRILRIAAVGDAGRIDLGNLYNIRWRQCDYAYQSGFNYQDAEQHQLPGLTCHNAAIANSICDGMQIYDFLAGDARYKTSLSNTNVNMYWLGLVRPWTYYGLLLHVKSLLSGLTGVRY